MKKLFSILVVISLLAVFVAPVALAAETIPDEINSCRMRHDLVDQEWKDKGFYCADKGDPCLFDDPANPTFTCGICCTMDTVYTITGWIFVGIVILATIMILIGAFNIMTAGGAPEKVNTGRSYIIFAAVGLIIALIAKVIPAIARNIIGM